MQKKEFSLMFRVIIIATHSVSYPEEGERDQMLMMMTPGNAMCQNLLNTMSTPQSSVERVDGLFEKEIPVVHEPLF